MSSLAVDVDQLIAELDAANPAWADWSGGWPGEIEVALIDAVLSIRATYGGSTTGVRAAIERYRQWRAAEHSDNGALDDLALLATLTPDQLVLVLRNRQRTMGGTKAEAIVEAAKALVAVGVESSFDLDVASDPQHAAYCTILGLGEISWQYLGLAVGKPGSEIVDASLTFIVDALARPVTLARAERIIARAAAVCRVTPLTIHRACWNATRVRRASPATVLSAG